MKFLQRAAVGLILAIATGVSYAKDWPIQNSDQLRLALANATTNDTITLAAGVYAGNFTVPTGVTLQGNHDAIIDAQGQGNALTLTGSDITIRNLMIRNWGDDLTEQNAGIYSDADSQNLQIINNTLSGDAFGMWIQNSQHGRIAHNRVSGNLTLRSADRGNAIQLSGVKHMVINDNRVWHVRDGLYVINSQNNVIENNHMSELRYGIHYMYSYDNEVKNNEARQTRAGYALMSSRRLIVTGNRSFDSEDYGFLMNYITYSTISHNWIERVWTKPENIAVGREGKGLFIYNSGYNTISHNLVKTTEIGIHLTAGSEQVKVYANSFIDNPTQVKYVSNAKQEWSQDGQGNFWSNYLGWDMDNNQRGDVAFEPNDGVDKLLWQYPEMKVLMDSPAVLILRWIQRQFPILKPPGVKDSFPLMSSPHLTQLDITTLANRSSNND